jgi:glyoxylase-like metal-dependent hydrolase (beta-lactamase superfamily II)
MGNKFIEWLSLLTTSKMDINPDILMLNFRIVNAFVIGEANNWVLVDTGLGNSANYILKTIEKNLERIVYLKQLF